LRENRSKRSKESSKEFSDNCEWICASDPGPRLRFKFRGAGFGSTATLGCVPLETLTTPCSEEWLRAFGNASKNRTARSGCATKCYRID
jgi:hypothetical protein